MLDLGVCASGQCIGNTSLGLKQSLRLALCWEPMQQTLHPNRSAWSVPPHLRRVQRQSLQQPFTAPVQAASVAPVAPQRRRTLPCNLRLQRLQLDALVSGVLVQCHQQGAAARDDRFGVYL